MQMPGRNGGEDYRYAFNGMEQDPEVSGDGNSYTTEFRGYDPRLGKWKSLDPLMASFPHTSPYVGFANNPIVFTDPYGLAPTGGKGKFRKQNRRNKGTVRRAERYQRRNGGQLDTWNSPEGWTHASVQTQNQYSTDLKVFSPKNSAAAGGGGTIAVSQVSKLLRILVGEGLSAGSIGGGLASGGAWAVAGLIVLDAINSATYKPGYYDKLDIEGIHNLGGNGSSINARSAAIANNSMATLATPFNVTAIKDGFEGVQAMRDYVGRLTIDFSVSLQLRPHLLYEIYALSPAGVETHLKIGIAGGYQPWSRPGSQVSRLRRGRTLVPSLIVPGSTFGWRLVGMTPNRPSALFMEQSLVDVHYYHSRPFVAPLQFLPLPTPLKSSFGL
jgi:RHS repeat-associated protein